MAGTELLSDQGLRIDGRKPNELRRCDIYSLRDYSELHNFLRHFTVLFRIRCSLGIFAQADGSAYLEQGNTKVLAAVYGPHEVIVFFCNILLVD